MSSAYHPESDGATERMNRTIGQMLRQCVSIEQDDWAVKLPAIEFAINSAKSEITGYSPFFLNTGRSMKPMIFEIENEKYKGVQDFAARVKDAIMEAHDSVLTNRVKQTINANGKRRPAPFVKGDLVYLSTENLSLPRGKSRKLSPKYVGPFKVVQEVVPATTFRLDLSKDLKNRGIHDVFHSKLLRPHIPNDDRRFPGRAVQQVTGIGDLGKEWLVEKIISHNGYGSNAVFEVLWQTGDRAWMDYPSIRHLTAMEDYLQLQGAKSIGELKRMEREVVNDELSTNSIRIGADPDAYIGVFVKDHMNRQLPFDERSLILFSRTYLQPPTTTTFTPNHNIFSMVEVPGARSSDCHAATYELMRYFEGKSTGPIEFPQNFLMWSEQNHGVDIMGLLKDGFNYRDNLKYNRNPPGGQPGFQATAPPVPVPPTFPNPYAMPAPPPAYTQPFYPTAPPVQPTIPTVDHLWQLYTLQNSLPHLIHPFPDPHILPTPLGIPKRAEYHPRGRGPLTGHYPGGVKPPARKQVFKAHNGKKPFKPQTVIPGMGKAKANLPGPQTKNKTWINKGKGKAVETDEGPSDLDYRFFEYFLTYFNSDRDGQSTEY
jgi:hypothetical protein